MFIYIDSIPAILLNKDVFVSIAGFIDDTTVFDTVLPKLDALSVIPTKFCVFDTTLFVVSVDTNCEESKLLNQLLILNSVGVDILL